MRPKLSRFFNQVAKACPTISRVVEGAAALMPPMPDMFYSRFLMKPRPRLSRLFNQVAARPFISRFMKGTAALMPPMPDIFSSRFLSKPRPPDRHLRPHWRPGKPKGPSR
ncbi:MAG: hypothetical protein WC815_20065 [Vicinamibacterales bacterium]